MSCFCSYLLGPRSVQTVMSFFFAERQLWRDGFCYASPDFVACFPKEVQLMLSHHVLTPLCAHPSLPILLTAQRIGQLLLSLQRGTNL